MTTINLEFVLGPNVLSCPALLYRLQRNTSVRFVISYFLILLTSLCILRYAISLTTTNIKISLESMNGKLLTDYRYKDANCKTKTLGPRLTVKFQIVRFCLHLIIFPSLYNSALLLRGEGMGVSITRWNAGW